VHNAACFNGQDEQAFAQVNMRGSLAALLMIQAGIANGIKKIPKKSRQNRDSYVYSSESTFKGIPHAAFCMSQTQPNPDPVQAEPAGIGRDDWPGSGQPDPDAPRPAVLEPPPEKELDDAGAAAMLTFDLDAAVRTHESRLLRYAAAILGRGSRDDSAQDVVQEVFLRLHTHVLRHGQASIEHLPAWLCKAAHNLAIDAIRKRTLDQNAIQNALLQLSNAVPEARGGSAESAMEKQESHGRALAALDNLTPELRGLVLLRIDQGLTIRQIAEVTGLSPGNVGYRINQALTEMATNLKKQGVI